LNSKWKSFCSWKGFTSG